MPSVVLLFNSPRGCAWTRLMLSEEKKTKRIKSHPVVLFISLHCFGRQPVKSKLFSLHVPSTFWTFFSRPARSYKCISFADDHGPAAAASLSLHQYVESHNNTHTHTQRKKTPSEPMILSSGQVQWTVFRFAPKISGYRSRSIGYPTHYTCPQGERNGPGLTRKLPRGDTDNYFWGNDDRGPTILRLRAVFVYAPLMMKFLTFVEGNGPALAPFPEASERPKRVVFRLFRRPATWLADCLATGVLLKASSKNISIVCRSSFGGRIATKKNRIITQPLL